MLDSWNCHLKRALIAFIFLKQCSFCFQPSSLLKQTKESFSGRRMTCQKKKSNAKGGKSLKKKIFPWRRYNSTWLWCSWQAYPVMCISFTEIWSTLLISMYQCQWFSNIFFPSRQKFYPGQLSRCHSLSAKKLWESSITSVMIRNQFDQH